MNKYRSLKLFSELNLFFSFIFASAVITQYLTTNNYKWIIVGQPLATRVTVSIPPLNLICVQELPALYRITCSLCSSTEYTYNHLRQMYIEIHGHWNLFNNGY